MVIDTLIEPWLDIPMSNTATTNAAFESARLLIKMQERGMSFAEVNAAVGGKPSDEDIAAMADTFRSDTLRVRFLDWVAA